MTQGSLAHGEGGLARFSHAAAVACFNEEKEKEEKHSCVWSPLISSGYCTPRSG